MKKFLCLFVVACMFLGCLSTKPVISADVTSPELVQKAQTAANDGNYDLAIYYYEETIKRFSYDVTIVISCEYEMAFIEYKRGNTKKAIEGMTNVLKHYEAPDASLYPARYKILAEQVLYKKLGVNK